MRIRSCILLAVLLGVGHSLLADVLYSVTALGTLGGSYSTGYAVNNVGQVTGASYTSDGHPHAFLYSNGEMTDLGTLGDVVSAGYGINNATQVTGDAVISPGFDHAFLYSNGQMTDLGTLGDFHYHSGLVFSFSSGSGINDAGQVTGWSITSDGHSHAILYSNGQMTDLGTLGGDTDSQGHGINNAGQVTGESRMYSGLTHAFLYSNGQMVDLGTLGGGTSSEGNGINNAGQVTGSSSTSSGDSHAFLYSNGQMIDLGPGTGLAINNSGQVVGTFNGRALLYSNGQMLDLNDLIDPKLGIALTDARGINDGGQIIADASSGPFTFEDHAYLLTPVPEPSTVGLLGVSLLGLLVCSRSTNVSQ